jgi:hypothetical protein
METTMGLFKKFIKDYNGLKLHKKQTGKQGKR